MNHIKQGMMFVSGDNKEWWFARDHQVDAYNAFISQDTTNCLKFVFNNGKEYVKIRGCSDGQNNRWVEIQDRTPPHKWRVISFLDIPKAPSPKS